MISCWKMRAFFSFQNAPVNQEGDGVKVLPPRALWKRRTGCNGRGFIWLTIAGMAGRQVGMVGAGRWLPEMAAGAWDLGGGRDQRGEDRWGAIMVEIGTRIA
jgi:hypothetical protein